MGVWQRVDMDSLKCHPSPPCPTLLPHASGPPLKRPSFTLLNTQRRTPMVEHPLQVTGAFIAWRWRPLRRAGVFRAVFPDHSHTKLIDFGINSNHQNTTLCHQIDSNEALREAIPGLAVRPVQGWPPAGRRVVGAKRGLTPYEQNGTTP
jgi:hypothetical protein